MSTSPSAALPVPPSPGARAERSARATKSPKSASSAAATREASSASSTTQPKRTRPKATTTAKTTTTTTTSTPAPTAAEALSARVEALTGVFTALGARDPERWARVHVEHGQDQIGRFVFLKGVWGRVARDGRFLDRMRRDPGHARELVERLLVNGAAEDDLVHLVRTMQVQLLVDLMQILDDPSDNDEGIRWGLWRMDRRGLPLWQLGDLRLDVLDVDPADDA